MRDTLSTGGSLVGSLYTGVTPELKGIHEDVWLAVQRVLTQASALHLSEVTIWTEAPNLQPTDYETLEGMLDYSLLHAADSRVTAMFFACGQDDGDVPVVFATLHFSRKPR